MKCFRGASVLELLLAVIVVSLASVLAFRLVSSTISHARVVRMVHEINELTVASYTWLHKRKQENFLQPSPITLARLLRAGVLKKEKFGSSVRGRILVKPGKNARYVHIELAGLSRSACRALVHELETVSHSAPPQCASKTGNIYYGDF